MSIIRTISYQLQKPFAKKTIKARGIIAILLLISLVLPAQPAPNREYQLKAAFLLNFTRFVEWPEAALAANGAPLIIAVLGENPFGSYLEEIVAGEKVNGHPVNIHYYKNTSDIKTCHVLYINFTEIKKMEEVLNGLKGRNILTVSDAPNFPAAGGMIRFFTKDNKIKFQVNLEASKSCNLTISSKLLRLAEIFTQKKNN
jgi:hypothetical protein